MHRLFCKRLALVLSSGSRALGHSKTQLDFLQFDDISSIHIIRSFSSSLNTRSSEPEEYKQSFTESYLINSCGLSLKTAISASKRVHLQTPDRPDFILALLRNHGFSKTHISKLVSGLPTMLLANPEKVLLAKFDFFYSIGVSSTDLPKILSREPSLLMRSLEKHLIPTYNFLKSVVPEARVAVAFRRSARLFCHNGERRIGPKVAFLRGIGVPESSISVFITCCTSTALQNNEKFIENADKVVKMGFHPSKSTFVIAVHVISQITKSTLEHKKEIYRRWGWSEDEIWMAFKMHPLCMTVSE